ncbi:MAG: S26 family signal peptidase [Pirellulales bacterium]|nr:S26 family signal peptidase [Pirellulales bacterium]
MSVPQSETTEPDSALLPAEAPVVSPPAIDGTRETIESIVVAFLLAFLFRTFIAEAYVIPTGSMAPTLLGRHKDLLCPECGYRYQVNASEEVDPRSGYTYPPSDKKTVVAGICPLCRFRTRMVDLEPPAKDEPSYKGDRILVAKGVPLNRQPQRWDVIVFKYPGEAEMNYIKRLAGLPGETVRIERGDLLVRTPEGEKFELARKPPAKMRALLQIVHNNDYPPSWIRERGWPDRWQSAPAAAWHRSADGRSFDCAAADSATLEYRHLVPTQRDWDRFEEGPLPADYPFKPQLIADACAYNSGAIAADPGEVPLQSLGVHWVGDLAVELELRSTETPVEASRVELALVRAGRRFTCRLDLSAQRAELGIDGLDGFHPAAKIDLPPGSARQLLLAHVDRQLLLWIDGQLVEFDAATTYDDLGDRRPTAEDLVPVRIVAERAAVDVRHLRVLRDVYYIASRFNSDPINDYLDPSDVYPGNSEAALAEFLATPERWDVYVDGLRNVDFALGPDEFFPLGDNSGRSADGRLWGGSEYFVRRELLVGRALLVYWPHAWPTAWHVDVRGTDVQVPFVPQFGRMGWIR